jgi:hypothetical protein
MNTLLKKRNNKGKSITSESITSESISSEPIKRLVLIDTSCASFQLEAIANAQDNPWDALAKLIDCYDSNGGLIKRDNELISVIWCFDTKGELETGGTGYWRHAHLKEVGVDYKPRRPVNEGIDTIKQIITQRIPSERQARLEYFEADDIIANLCHQFKDYLIDIVTVDTDLLQLVTETTRWVNTARYEPVIRDLTATKAYALKKWGTVITDPRQIVDIKVSKGDPSDGLYTKYFPNGIDPGYIDLREPIVRCPYTYDRPLQWIVPSGNTSGVYYEAAHCPILEPKQGFVLGKSS